MAACYPHDKLVQWAVQNGGFFHDDVEVVFDPERGYYMIVKPNRSLPENTRIASCPMACTLSILNALDREGGFSCRSIKLPRPFLQNQPREIVERFYLMEQYLLEDKSWWAPYIATLPTPEDVRQFAFEDEDLTWLHGTNLATALQKQKDQWKELYEKGIGQLKTLGWRNARKGAPLTLDLFIWASTIFASRSFTSAVLTDTLPADQARPMGRFSRSKTSKLRQGSGDEHDDYEELTKLFSDGFPVLLPVLDILNYRPLAKVEWQARVSLVGLEVLEAVSGGQEVCNNYGPRDNEALLLAYSFALPDNPFDHFSVSIRVPPHLPLADIRSWSADPFRKRQLDLKCYVFNPEHPRAKDSKSLETALFSLDLLDSISVLTANDRELQAMFDSKRTLMSRALQKGRFEDSRNLLATLSQLFRECRARLDVLRKNAPEPGSILSNQKQKYAQMYRQSQEQILENATLVCELVLKRANGQGTTDQILQAISQNAQLNEQNRTRFEKMVRMHECISNRNELFSVKQLLADLPEPSLARIREQMVKLSQLLFNTSETATNCSHRECGTSTPAFIANNIRSSKYFFAILISAMYTHSSGSALAQQQSAWLTRLTEWYPPDDPNWSYVPDRQPTEPEGAPPEMLLDLLDAARALSLEIEPKILCWAWNVLEEEGVTVPLGLLHTAGEVKDQNELGFLMYVQETEDRL